LTVGLKNERDLGWAKFHDTHHDTTTIAKFEYFYDYNGNITDQFFHHRASTPGNNYGYDNLNRLVTIDYIDDNDKEFIYDKTA